MDNKGLTKNDSQCLKGVGIILMIFYHLFRAEDVFQGHSVSFFPFEQSTVVAISYLCKICVCVFAFVSGYGLLKSVRKTENDRTSTAKWNATRLIKTLSGFWFVYIISFVGSFIIDKQPVLIYFKGSVLKGILYIVIDFLGLSNLLSTPMLIGTWWYMSAAVIYILAVPLIYRISKKVGYLPILIVVTLLPMALKIGFTGGRNPYTFLPVMILGMVFADYNIFEKISDRLPKSKVLSYILSLILFGSASAFFAFMSERKDDEAGWQLMYAVFPVAVICFLRYCIIRIPVIKNVLAFIGKYSMTMFLTHTFIRYTYLNDFTYSFGNFAKIFAVLFVLSLLLAIVLDTIKKLVRYDKLVDIIIKKSSLLIDEIITVKEK